MGRVHAPLEKRNRRDNSFATSSDDVSFNVDNIIRNLSGNNFLLSCLGDFMVGDYYFGRGIGEHDNSTNSQLPETNDTEEDTR